MARAFELIAPLQPILHRVSCSNEMVPSAPKHYEMPPKHAVDRVDLLQKILRNYVASTFAFITTVRTVFNRVS